MNTRVLEDKESIYYKIARHQYDVVIKEYPELEDYIEFLKFMIENKKLSTNYFIKYDFECCLKACDDLRDRLDMIMNEKQFVSHIMSNVHLDRWLTLLFKPEFYEKNPNIALNIMQEVMDDADYHNIPINNLRLRELIEWVRYIRDNYAGLIDFVPTPMLAYYGYLYNKYEYLERYLQDHEYYREYFISNFFNLSNINPILLTNHIFKNIPDIFKKRDIDIK